MYAFVCVGIERFRLILIADLEDRIFNRPIVQAEGDLLHVAPSASAIAVVLVGVDLVVPDDRCEGRSLPEAFGRKLRQEFRHEVIIALDVKSVHALWRNADAAVATDSRQ